MEIEYDTTMDDVVEFNMFNLKHNPQLRRRMTILRVIYAVCTAIMVIIGIISATIVFNPRNIIISFFLVALFGFYYWYSLSPSMIKRRVIKTVKKHYDKIPNEEICHHKMTISGLGVNIVTDFANSSVRWPAISELVTDGSLLYFLLRPGKAFVVPKRAFADETASSLFFETAKEYKAKAGK